MLTPDTLNAPTEVSEVWNVEAPVTPIPPEVTWIAAEWTAIPLNNVVVPNAATPDTPRPVPAFIFPETPNPPTIVKAPLVEEVELVLELSTVAPLTVNPPVTPNPPAVIFTLEANVATPVTPRVEEAVKAPTEVNEVWNIDAPVIPIPPEVTNKAALCEATPAKVDVEPNIAVPETPRPVPILTSPDTPKPPTIVKAPEVDDTELVLDVKDSVPIFTVEPKVATPLTVNPPVTPKPPPVIFTFEANVATPVTDNVELKAVAPVTPRPAARFTYPLALIDIKTAPVEDCHCCRSPV